jgi:hypothetical protein
VNKYRKQILLGVLGVILVLYGGDWAMRNKWLSDPLEGARKKNAKLREELVTRERDFEKFRKVIKEIDVLKNRSLPANADVARSLYRAWLLELVGQADFMNPNIDSSEPANRKGLYQVLSFSLRGRTTLPQLVKFLFEFYNADHLHQIRSLVISPLQGNDYLDVQMAIEALILPKVDRKDRLNSQKSDRLASTSIDDYQVIMQRNLFGLSPTAEASSYTFLTSVTSVNDQPEAWFTVRTNDTVLKLRKGEVLEVGQFKGTVVDIADADVILESDGERWLLTIGENLTRATALPPER